MAEAVRSVSPDSIVKNPDNPRLIFHAKELQELEDSIAAQGILVPLTVYADADGYVILDGERRWRSARRLALSSVPVIVYPKPPRMRNIMMMFAIHNARMDWDPLPTALKLRELEELFTRENGRVPLEAELAQLASLSRGEVRRLKNILGLPEKYLAELRIESEKPREEQRLTVDHVLEVTRASKLLMKRDVVDSKKADALNDALVGKFRTKQLTSTVEPRLLAKLARAVERQDLPVRTAVGVVDRLIAEPSYSVQQAYADSVERVDLEHNLDLAAGRLIDRIHASPDIDEYSPQVVERLKELRAALDELLGRSSG
jgi:ParB/RepB/Spo0J family partition protein